MVSASHADVASAHATQSLIVSKTLVAHLRVMVRLVHLDWVDLHEVSSIDHVHRDHGGATSGGSATSSALRHVAIRLAVAAHVGHVWSTLLVVEIEQLDGVNRHRMTFLVEKVADSWLIIIRHHVVHARLALATGLLRRHGHVNVGRLVHGELVLLLLQLLELLVVRALQIL